MYTLGETLTRLDCANWLNFLESDVLNLPVDSVVGDQCLQACLVANDLLDGKFEPFLCDRIAQAVALQCSIWLKG